MICHLGFISLVLNLFFFEICITINCLIAIKKDFILNMGYCLYASFFNLLLQMYHYYFISIYFHFYYWDIICFFYVFYFYIYLLELAMDIINLIFMTFYSMFIIILCLYNLFNYLKNLMIKTYLNVLLSNHSNYF
jgi:hypothetical protein